MFSSITATTGMVLLWSLQQTYSCFFVGGLQSIVFFLLCHFLFNFKLKGDLINSICTNVVHKFGQAEVKQWMSHW